MKNIILFTILICSPILGHSRPPSHLTEIGIQRAWDELEKAEHILKNSKHIQNPCIYSVLEAMLAGLRAEMNAPEDNWSEIFHCSIKILDSFLFKLESTYKNLVYKTIEFDKKSIEKFYYHIAACCNLTRQCFVKIGDPPLSNPRRIIVERANVLNLENLQIHESLKYSGPNFSFKTIKGVEMDDKYLKAYRNIAQQWIETFEHEALINYEKANIVWNEMPFFNSKDLMKCIVGALITTKLDKSASLGLRLTNRYAIAVAIILTLANRCIDSSSYLYKNFQTIRSCLNCARAHEERANKYRQWLYDHPLVTSGQDDFDPLEPFEQRFKEAIEQIRTR